MESALLFFRSDKWPELVPNVSVRHWIESCFNETSGPIPTEFNIEGVYVFIFFTNSISYVSVEAFSRS